MIENLINVQERVGYQSNLAFILEEIKSLKTDYEFLSK